jgi:hypothetical protein
MDVSPRRIAGWNDFRCGIFFIVPGSGNVTAPDLAGDALKVGLPGSGTITLDGTANRVDIRLSGSGSVFCDELQAKAAEVTVSG